MPRSRLLLFAGLLGVLLLGTGLSVVRVSGDELVLAGGRALGPGTHLVLPWTPRSRVPLSSELSLPAVPVRAPDGTPMSVSLDLRVGLDPEPLRISAAELAAADGWAGYLSARAGAALSGALEDWPRADPMAAEPRHALEAAVREALEGPGLAVQSVTLEGGEDPGWRGFRERRIRALSHPSNRKVLIVGLDGADWQIVDPLLARGRLPGLAKLLANGVRADLRSNEPMLSPLLWTTVATGKPPEEHGIVDFLLVEPGTGRRVPMSSTFRRTKALWNILTDLGRDSAFVAWWATWPAERIEGTMVTDRVSYSLFAGITPSPGEGSAGLTFPPGYIAEVEDRLARPEEIGYEQVRRFLQISRAEYEAGRKKLREKAAGPPEDPVVALARVLASASTYHAIGLDLIRRGQPELLALYYEGIDQIGHRFMHYAPPKMELSTAAEFERYRNTVSAYYEYQDELLQEITAAADPSTVFLVLSDHGFKNGSGRPRALAPYVSEKPGFWHRRYGIFALSGPGIRRGALDTVSLYDIAPTVLHLLGLPPTEDMPGRVLQEAFASPDPMKPLRIGTYEGIGERSQAQVTTAAGSAIEEEMVRELTALGYLSPGALDEVAQPAGSGGAAGGVAGDEVQVTANYHLNLASILAGQEKYEEAEAEIRAALAKAPIPDGYRMLSEILEKRGDRDGAIRAQRGLLEAQGGDAARLRLIGLLLDDGQVEEAREFSEAGFESTPMGATARGLVAERDGRSAEAMQLYRQALEEEPTLAAAMIRLYPLTPPDRLGELEPIVVRGLERNDQLASYHNVLGVIRKGRGDLAGAIQSYRRALELDPDQADYLANLGNAEMIRGRLDVALEILERARRKAPENADVWVTLGTVHGKAGRAPESLAAFQRAVELGAGGSGVAVGIALAHLQMDDPVAARRVIDEARIAYPSDPMLAELDAAIP